MEMSIQGFNIMLVQGISWNQAKFCQTWVYRYVKCCTLKTSSRTVSIRAQLNLTLLSMSNWTRSCNLSMPNYWAWSYQLSMSTRTQTCNLSMPNQWARSCLLSMSTRTKLVIYQFQTYGHDLVSCQYQHGHKLVIYQCQTSGHADKYKRS